MKSLRIAGRLRQSSRRVVGQTEELAHIRTAVPVDVVIVAAREATVPVAIIARNVAVVELQRSGSVRTAEQALNGALGIQIVVHVALPMVLAELLLEDRQRTDEF